VVATANVGGRWGPRYAVALGLILHHAPASRSSIDNDRPREARASRPAAGGSASATSPGTWGSGLVSGPGCAYHERLHHPGGV